MCGALKAPGEEGNCLRRVAGGSYLGEEQSVDLATVSSWARDMTGGEHVECLLSENR